MAKKPKFQNPADTDKLWDELVADLIVPSQLDLSTAEAIQSLINRRSDAVYFEVGGRGIWLTDNTARLYYRIAYAVSREAKMARIASKEYAQRALQPAIHRALGDHEAGHLSEPKDYLEDVRRELRGNVSDWIVVAPIAGVSLSAISALNLGDTRLIGLGSDGAKGLIADLDAMASAGAAPPPDQGTARREFHLGPLSEQSPFPAVAVTAVKACDSSRALDSGIGIIEQFTASLRVFRWLADRNWLHAPMGLPREIPMGGVPAIAFTPHGLWATSHAGSARPGLTFAIDPETISRLNDLGWQSLSAIWAKDDNASDWERTLRSAAWWLGMAIGERHDAVAFVKFATALEILLCQDGLTEGVADRVAERLALVIRDEPKFRVNVWRAMKKLYEVRSGVVHGGFADVLGEDLALVRQFALECFFTLLKQLDEITSFGDLVKLCVRKRFEAEPKAAGEGLPAANGVK